MHYTSSWQQVMSKDQFQGKEKSYQFVFEGSASI